MYALTLAGIPISIGANEAVHQQRLLDEEAEAEERQEEFYLDVFCDAQSKKKDQVNGAIVVLRDGKVTIFLCLFTYFYLSTSSHQIDIFSLTLPTQVWLSPKNSETGLPNQRPIAKKHHIRSQASTCHVNNSHSPKS